VGVVVETAEYSIYRCPSILGHHNKYQFSGGPFQEVLKDSGIAFEPSPPYTPEFNGMAEHFNRGIVSMVRAMLAGANMSTGFWVEALKYAVCQSKQWYLSG